ncbi:MAG: histidine phosphatase family protein [Bacteroidales bacterium]|nr:histidine phosphatase family protein [Bacteroidales bacterium]
MRLILLRHGETIDNTKGIIQGHLPGKLNENGILQAQKAALRLSKEKIDILYSSDLYRAVETAAEVLKILPKLQAEYTEELRELNMGVNQGKTKEELNWQNEFKGIYIPPEGGESTEDLYERIEKFLHYIAEKHQNKTVLCVSHGGTIKAFISVLTGVDKSQVFAVQNIKNTSISIFEILDNLQNKVVLLNDVSHLEKK